MSLKEILSVKEDSCQSMEPTASLSSVSLEKTEHSLYSSSSDIVSLSDDEQYFTAPRRNENRN
jgi:hypothetical protein